MVEVFWDEVWVSITYDLNLRAQKEREVRKSDLDQLERYADRLFASLGIDVEFTKHFLDRVNDERNETNHTLRTYKTFQTDIQKTW